MSARRGRRLVAGALFVLAALLATTGARAQTKADPVANQRYFTDVELVNQHGQTMRLYQDLMADKTVVINAFFTECTGVCPVMAKKLARIQEAFAGRMGTELHLISMSVDPIADSPEELMKFARRYGAGDGWYFVGGNKENVALALGKLGQYVDEREAHSNLLLIGNLRTGMWKKVLGIAKEDELARHVAEVLDDPGAGAEAGAADPGSEGH